MADARVLVARVFPRRTSFTPTDDMAFIGSPPLWRPEASEVHVSITFTWDIEKGKRLADAWAQYYPVVKIGGPAMNTVAEDFTPGMYVKKGVIFTSRGCQKSCPWCLVPLREGVLRLLPVQPGWIIQDNNLLQTPREHQAGVYAMLRQQKRRAIFSGGLDATLLDDWAAEQLRSVPIAQVFLAADTEGALKPLQRAISKLSFLRRDQLRCYMLLGFGGEQIATAQKRLEAVWELGALPFAQLYQPPDHRITYPNSWRDLARLWSRPAATKAIHHD